MKLTHQSAVSFLILLFISANCFSQAKINDQFQLFDYTIKLEKKELQKILNNCDASINTITVNNSINNVYAETICTAEIDDVRFAQKGYLTIIEHYSSPVGWTVYYIFDLCKESIIKTKQIDEGIKLTWYDFINPTTETEKKYIESTAKF